MFDKKRESGVMSEYGKTSETGPATGDRGLTGVILAGGLGRRFGGTDKALLSLGGQPLIHHVATRLRAQVATVAINANGDPARFAPLGLPVIPDSLPDRPGPLAGVLAGMEWAEQQGFSAIVTVSTDAPFFPETLVATLCQHAGNGPAIAAAKGAGVPRSHPTFGLWPVSLAPDLRHFLQSGERRLMAWAERCGARTVVFSEGRDDPFLNINSATELAEAEARLARAGGPA